MQPASAGPSRLARAGWQWQSWSRPHTKARPSPTSAATRAGSGQTGRRPVGAGAAALAGLRALDGLPCGRGRQLCARRAQPAPGCGAEQRLPRAERAQRGNLLVHAIVHVQAAAVCGRAHTSEPGCGHAVRVRHSGTTRLPGLSRAWPLVCALQSIPEAAAGTQPGLRQAPAAGPTIRQAGSHQRTCQRPAHLHCPRWPASSQQPARVARTLHGDQAQHGRVDLLGDDAGILQAPRRKGRRQVVHRAVGVLHHDGCQVGGSLRRRPWGVGRQRWPRRAVLPAHSRPRSAATEWLPLWMSASHAALGHGERALAQACPSPPLRPACISSQQGPRPQSQAMDGSKCQAKSGVLPRLSAPSCGRAKFQGAGLFYLAAARHAWSSCLPASR